MPSLDDHIDLCDEFANRIMNVVVKFNEEKKLDTDSFTTVAFTVFSSYCALIIQGAGGTKKDFVRSLEKCYDYQIKDTAV